MNEVNSETAQTARTIRTTLLILGIIIGLSIGYILGYLSGYSCQINEDEVRGFVDGYTVVLPKPNMSEQYYRAYIAGSKLYTLEHKQQSNRNYTFNFKQNYIKIDCNIDCNFMPKCKT